MRCWSAGRSNGFTGGGLNGSGSANGDDAGFENSDSAGFDSPNGDGIGGVEFENVGRSSRSFDVTIVWGEETRVSTELGEGDTASTNPPAVALLLAGAEGATFLTLVSRG